MRIVSLNCWGGNKEVALLDWFRGIAKDVDIFCLQEVYSPISGHETRDLFNAIGDALGNEYIGWFSPTQRGLYLNHIDQSNPNISSGLAMFVRLSVAKVLDFQQSFIVGHRDMLTVEEVSSADYTTYADRLPRALQTLHFEYGEDGTHWIVGNYHGMWQSHGKGDSVERFLQSNRLIQQLKYAKKTFSLNHVYKVVLCGDFNVRPDTQAFRRIEDNGVIKFNELVTLYNYESTRTSLYNKPCKFADYMFVSRNIDLGSFEVLDIPISDHCPLIAHVM